MNKFLTLCLKILAAAGFLVCVGWAWQHPDYEPIAAALGCLGGFLTLFVVERKSKPRLPAIRQRGGDNSTNYQAGGDMTINSKS
ncbi:hypothetical protein [Hymenobacter cheonanensis]|uniref:hypothetical protein n=1 Tax=Hymenobacter sp. CA2-7 TaxID=3063993 RepID=UPI002712CE14|nr:hypothetical protein [Hymenobacter sp. CA2-7]MDO7888180.1 hypothetical protein [Hymenobacter sp. CA2-7]